MNNADKELIRGIVQMAQRHGLIDRDVPAMVDEILDREAPPPDADEIYSLPDRVTDQPAAIGYAIYENIDSLTAPPAADECPECGLIGGHDGYYTSALGKCEGTGKASAS